MTSTRTATVSDRVEVCHRTGSRRNPYVRIEISRNALPAHQAHGDIYPVPPGGCPAEGTPVTMTATPAPTETVAPCYIQFRDVQQGHTFYPFVRCLACREVFGGYDDGTFRPDNEITRGQLAKIVSNAAGFGDTPAGQRFTDVPPDSPFYVWIERLAARNILGGYNDGTFRPYNPTTRGQIAKIVANAGAFYETVTGQTFNDVAPGDTFYEYIERVARREVVGGYSDGTFRPYNNATRGQVSKFVSNGYHPICDTPGDR